MGVDQARAIQRVRRYAGELLANAGLPELCPLVGYEPRVATEGPGSQARPVKSGKPASARQAEKPSADNDAYDFVGIVMAKSAEGDAVAQCLGRRRASR